MDQIFDRLGKLLQSMLSGDSDERESVDGTRRSYGDPDLDAAMAELDEDLTRDQEERERLRKAREEREARERSSAQAGSSSAKPSGPPQQIIDDYVYLGLPVGAPFEDVKAAYKRLLKKHHPDRHSGSPENLKKATAVSARINEAYHHLETWTATGKLPKE